MSSTTTWKKLVLSAIASLMVVMSVSVPAFAHNVDKPVKFEFKYKNHTQGTDPERKDDYSSSYVRIDDITPGGIKLYIDGAFSRDGRYDNVTVNGVARASARGEFRIRNNVKETGRSWARLTGWNEFDRKFNVYGVWSPDSMRNYTPLN